MNTELVETRPGSNVFRGTGNVFRDLSLDDAEECHVKVQLAVGLLRLIKARRLTRSKAAKLMEIDQARLTALRHNRLDEFSIVELLKFATGLEYDVVIAFRPFLT